MSENQKLECLYCGLIFETVDKRKKHASKVHRDVIQEKHNLKNDKASDSGIKCEFCGKPQTSK